VIADVAKVDEPDGAYYESWTASTARHAGGR